MTKFFQQIRLFLLKETGIRKYLLHAAGEVFLIIIGILVALQINNWNSDRLEREKERKILLEMKKNLKKDLQNIDGNKDRLSNEMKSIAIILKQLDNKAPFHDTLGQHYFQFITSGTTFFKNTSAFENLKSIGFDLVENDYLRYMITRLYAGHYEYIIELEQRFTAPIKVGHLLPLITSNLVIDGEKTRPVNQKALYDDHTFKESLRYNASFAQVLFDGYSYTTALINELIAEIEKEFPGNTYTDVGIIGSALDSGWEKSVPMKLIDKKHGIWEVVVSLKKGEVKFRAHDSWSENWGGGTFPSGTAVLNGDNIPVEAGKYRVRLDLNKERHQFVKLSPDK